MVQPSSVIRSARGAKIGFVIFYPFQFYVFKNIYRELGDIAEFIIDSGRLHSLPQPEEAIGACAKLLEQNGVRYRIFPFEDYFRERNARLFFEPYEVLVSLWWSGSIGLPCNTSRKKVHINYGAGKELTMFSPHHRMWDLYLCLNPHIHEIIKLFTAAEVVGYPKFDDWFNGTVGDSDSTVLGLPEHVTRGKKVLLYLPTHGDLCSIDALVFELKKLARKYAVIAKLHYYTTYIEPARKELLRDSYITLLGDETDLLPLLQRADLVISDNSSAIFDALLADKPVIATDFLSAEYLDQQHKKVKQYPARPLEGALTYSQSVEQRVKRDGTIISFSRPADLPDAVRRGLADEPSFRERRRALRNELFAFNDGKCAARAAEAIERLRVARALPERPILYHVFQNYRIRSGYTEQGMPPSSLYQNEYIYRKTRRGRDSLIRAGARVLEIKSMPLAKRLVALAKEFF